MTLDDDGRAMHRSGFNDVRIKRSLPEKAKPTQFLGALLENMDERAADDFALLFRIGDARKSIEEDIRGIDKIEWQMQLVPKPFLNLVGLFVTQQPVVDEDARQTIANGAMNQHCGNR